MCEAWPRSGGRYQDISRVFGMSGKRGVGSTTTPEKLSVRGACATLHQRGGCEDPSKNPTEILTAMSPFESISERHKDGSVFSLYSWCLDTADTGARLARPRIQIVALNLRNWGGSCRSGPGIRLGSNEVGKATPRPELPGQADHMRPRPRPDPCSRPPAHTPDPRPRPGVDLRSPHTHTRLRRTQALMPLQPPPPPPLLLLLLPPHTNALPPPAPTLLFLGTSAQGPPEPRPLLAGGSTPPPSAREFCPPHRKK